MEPRLLGLRILMPIAVVVAGLCLLRVFQVHAAEIDNDEAYSEEVADDSDDEQASIIDDSERLEIRLSRPEEAQERIAESKDELVPGAERLATKDPELPAIPEANRSIASELKTTQNIPKLEPDPGSLKTRVGTQEVSLIVTDTGFFPSRIFVTQNVPVKLFLTAPANKTLCFMVDSFGIRKGVIPGKVEEITFTASEPGNYRFYCPVTSIEGTITVRDQTTKL